MTGNQRLAAFAAGYFTLILMWFMAWLGFGPWALIVIVPCSLTYCVLGWWWVTLNRFPWEEDER